MIKQDFRRHAYDCYSSSFKGLSQTNFDGPAAQRQRQYLKRQLTPWLTQFQPSATIADLGCGHGMLLRVFQEMGFNSLCGVDVSEEMVALCRAHFPAVEADDLQEYLKRNVRSFDLVVMFDVLEHFSREEALEVLQLTAQALRANGHLLLQLPNGDSPFAGSVFAGDITHEVLYTAGSLSHLLRMARFRVISSCECSPEPMDLRSTLRAVAWQCLRQVIRACHVIETGGTSSGVYSRVMRVFAQKATI